MSMATHSISSMRAIQIDRYGGLEELKLEEQPRPEPQAGEALLRVYAAGVNPIDWKIREGMLREVQPVQFPYIPGVEVAGVVDAVGPGRPDVEIGEAVYGSVASGAYAEYVVAPVKALA